MMKSVYKRFDDALQSLSLALYRSVLAIGNALSVVLYGSDSEGTGNTK